MNTSLDDWSFQVEEVSGGVYQVMGTAKDGRRIEMTGLDPVDLLKQCQAQALKMPHRSGPATERAREG